MASNILAMNAIFGVPNATVPGTTRGLSLRPTPKVSRICFTTSVSKQDEAYETSKDAVKATADAAQENADKLESKVKEDLETAKEKATEGQAAAAKTAENFSDKAKEAADSAFKGAEETGQKIKDAVTGLGDDTTTK